jgi:cytochrome c peroxidase
LFFHDGRFHELRDAVEYMSAVNDLEFNDQQIAALVEYLRTF